MMPFLDAIAAAGMEFFTRLGHALDEKRTGFSDYEAGDFLAAGGRMESDGPDAAACTCPPWGNPSWPHRYGCPADPRLSDPAVLLRRAADHLDSSACALDALVPDTGHRLVADPLIAGLRDLAAHFDADEQPAT